MSDAVCVVSLDEDGRSCLDVTRCQGIHYIVSELKMSEGSGLQLSGVDMLEDLQLPSNNQKKACTTISGFYE